MGVVWSASEDERRVVVKVAGETYRYDEVSPNDIKELARCHGIARFLVKNEDGRCLSPDDFPVRSGTVIIEEYNEAK